MNAYLDAMRRYATFSGRSSRKQFWIYTLFLAIWLIIGIVLDSLLGTKNGQDVFLITGLINIAHLIPSLSVFVRRLHDSDKSGWWVLPSVIPIIGLIFACLPSSPGANRFGHPNTGRTAEGPQRLAAAEIRAPAQPARSTADRLEQLANLRASGAIDEAEFQRLKADIMQQA